MILTILILRVITSGFVLVDLGAPKLEALLFSVTTASFVLINIFLDDLKDPFSGSWNVDPARRELEALVTILTGLPAAAAIAAAIAIAAVAAAAATAAAGGPAVRWMVIVVVTIGLCYMLRLQKL